MGSIKDSAQNYEPPKTLNIADLEAISIQQEILERKFKEGTDDEFTINVIVWKGEDYRVPDVVLKQLKALIKAKPELKTFKVTKEGEGLKTSYMVIPLE